MPPAASSYPVLPDPPVLEYYVLESPWQIIALLTIAGLVLLLQANQKRNRKFMVAGIGCLVASLIFFVLSTSITTTRETLLKQNASLIMVSAPFSADDLRPYLTKDCAIYLDPTSTTPAVTFDQLQGPAWEKLLQVLDSNAIQRQDATLDSPTTARTQSWIKTYLKTDPVPRSSRWEFQWVFEDGQWKAKSARRVENPE